MQKTVTLSVFLSVLLVGCNTAPTETIPTPTPVVVAVAADGKIPSELALTGILAPREEVDIGAKTGGRIASLTIAVGSRITAGDVLTRLDADTESAVTKSIDANLAAAEKNLVALERLYAERIKSAETAIVLAKKSATGTTNLSDTQLTTARDDLRRQTTSTLTTAAIVTTTVADTLDALLGVTDKNRAANDTFEHYLGALDSSTRTAADAALRAYLAQHDTFRAMFNVEILNQNPDTATLDHVTPEALTTLESAKTVLEKTSTLLLKSSTGSDFSQATLDNHKTAITTLGGQVESVLATLKNLHGTEGVTSQIAILERQSSKTATDTAVTITQAELNLATLTRERDAKLAEANALVEGLRGQAGISATTLNATVIRAPHAGVITQKYVEAGAVVNPSQPIVRLADDSAMKLIVAVPDSATAAFTLGREATITVDGIANQTFTAKITKVAPTADPTAKKTNVELTLGADRRLKSGLFARANFTLGAENGIVIPSAALIDRYGQTFVFVVAEGKATERFVTIGTRTDTSVVITDGLKAGETVIVKGQRFLRDGDAIETIEK